MKQIDCPSCTDGSGPRGIYSPRPPVCLQCAGTREIEVCEKCGEECSEDYCELCDVCPDCGERVEDCRC